MDDLNFFEGHIEKRELKLDGKMISLVIFSVFTLFIIGYITYYSMLMKKEMKTITTLKQVLENADAVKNTEEINERQLEFSALKESVERIKIVDADISKRKKIDEILLANINHNMPNNIFLTSISIEKEEIYMEGISKDKWAIAEFEKNLESLEDYENIFVSYISLEDESYNFALEMTLKGIGDHENEEVAEDEGTNEK